MSHKRIPVGPEPTKFVEMHWDGGVLASNGRQLIETETISLVQDSLVVGRERAGNVHRFGWHALVTVQLTASPI
jgi:hypothetical protein